MTRFLMSTLGLALLTSHAAVAGPPAPVSLSTAEEAVLAKGEVAIRYAPPPGDGTLAVVDVAATPEATMDAVLDLQARVSDIGALKKVDIYEQNASRIGATWELGIAVYTITFSIAYDVDRTAGWCSYTLDGSKENDIGFSEGSYQVYPQGSGTRLVYRAAADADQKGPEWIRKKLAYDSASEMLGGMKRRAEAAD